MLKAGVYVTILHAGQQHSYITLLILKSPKPIVIKTFLLKALQFLLLHIASIVKPLPIVR